MLQANVCVLFMPPSFPAVPQYLGHTSVVPQPLAEPDKQLSHIRLFVQPFEVGEMPSLLSMSGLWSQISHSLNSVCVSPFTGD